MNSVAARNTNYRSTETNLPRLSSAGPALISVVALVLWLLALPGIDPARIDGRGLIGALTPLWYLAAVLALLSPCLLIVTRASNRLGQWFSLAILILIMYGTTSAVYELPRFVWTYKHIGVVNYLLLHHQVDRSIDIYQNWPGFFVLSALAVVGLRISALAQAQWFEPVAAMASAGALWWCLSGLGPRRLGRVTASTPAMVRDRVSEWDAVCLGSVLVFSVTNWIGQNYFSPQALTFPLSLIIIGQFIRMTPAPIHPSAWARRLLRLPPAKSVQVQPTPFWAGWRGVVITLITFTIIATSHQLSPVMTIAQGFLFGLLFPMRHRWLPWAFVLIEGLWLLQAWGFLNSRFKVVEIKGASNVAPIAGARPTDLPWAQFMSQTPRVLVAVVGVLGCLAALRMVTGRERAIAPGIVLLVIAPVAVILLQPYGQEGVFRAYLFALPWLSLLIARAYLAPRSSRSRRRPGILVFAIVYPLAALWLMASFCLELRNYVYPSDYRAVEWISQNAAPGTGLLSVELGVPYNDSATYDQHLQPQWSMLQTPMSLWPEAQQPLAQGTNEFVRFTDEAASWYPKGVYLVLGPGQEAVTRIQSSLKATVWSDYVAAISRDSNFKLVHQDGDTLVFKYTGAPSL